MSGRVILRPAAKHECLAGWTQRPPLPEGNLMGLPAGTVTWAPPRDSEFPVGCRWQCGACGKVWVRRKSPRTLGVQLLLGKVIFTPEHWWERWLRKHRP